MTAPVMAPTAAVSLVRVQDREGRGPWRPGFSHQWSTDQNMMVGKPINMEVKNFAKIVEKAHRAGMHIGHAVRPENLHLWFTQGELQTLTRLGFTLVDASNCEVLAETKTQALIAWWLPFSWLPPALGRSGASAASAAPRANYGNRNPTSSGGSWGGGSDEPRQ